MSEAKKPLVAYCNAMEEIKARLAVVRHLAQGGSAFARQDLNIEALCLFFRKTLELIAFSSLTAHRAAYEAVYNDISSQWRAKRILDRVEQQHPEFFPKPVRISGRDHRGVWMIENVGDGFLTKDDFEFLYDRCSAVIHARNPFRSNEVINFDRSLDEWALRVMRLLDHHIIKLSGSYDVWLVQMSRQDDQKVHAFLCPAVAEDTGQPLDEVRGGPQP